MSPLLVYLEDPPLGSEIAGTGLSKAFNATLSGLVSDLTRVCVAQTHGFVQPCYFISGWRAQPAWATPRSYRVISRISTWLPWSLAKRIARMQGFLLARTLRRRMPGLLPQGVRLLSPVGVDPLTLLRAKALADALSAKFEPYFVDDLLHHPANSQLAVYLSNTITDAVRHASQIYTITDGLGDLMRERHGVQTKTLRLVADCNAGLQNVKPIPIRATYFAFFLGSINHLYADGLNQLIDQVSNLRSVYRQDLKIRLSSSSEQVRAVLGQVPSWVIVGNIADSSQLCREIADSDFCFLPYSFGKDAKSMVESSFPSKMIDYLAHANAILVHAPNNSVPFKLLYDSGVPFVSDSTEMLNHNLIRVLHERPMHGKYYKKILDMQFSVSAMRKTLGFEENLQ